MSYIERREIEITTDASGDATAYLADVLGLLHSIQYVKDGTSPYDNGVDFVITGETSGQILWDEDNVNASKAVAPRQPTHDNAGVASLYAVAGEPVEASYALAKERVKIVVAQGGNTKKGRFIFHFA